MTITWRGLGYLGFLTPLFTLLLASQFGGINNFTAIRFCVLLSAAIVWFLGVHLNCQGLDECGEFPHQTFGFPMQRSALLSIAAFLLSFI